MSVLQVKGARKVHGRCTGFANPARYSDELAGRKITKVLFAADWLDATASETTYERVLNPSDFKGRTGSSPVPGTPDQGPSIVGLPFEIVHLPALSNPRNHWLHRFEARRSRVVGQPTKLQALAGHHR
jgi:hypothetical protein